MTKRKLFAKSTEKNKNCKMPIQHKFYHKDWGNGFATERAILTTTPYDPEVLILGTFNPTMPGNMADFFYGRNYFWPAFANLFTHGQPLLLSRRDHQAVPEPMLQHIFDLCELLRLSFADLVAGILHHDNPAYEEIPPNQVLFDGDFINIIQDQGLHALDLVHQTDWNTDAVIDYLCHTPTIHTIYFTRQPTGIWEAPWKAIRNHPLLQHKTFTHIYTPSGQALRGQPRMHALLHHWVHHVGPNFGRLQPAWLQHHQVDPQAF